MAKFLLGFMGSGKTTVAKYLKGRVVDMDALIEEKIGMTISDFFATKGEAAFRAIESETLEELLKLEGDTVISTGGGVVLSEKNRELLRLNRRNNVLLTTSFEVVYRRIQKDSQAQRPLFQTKSKEEFQDLFQRRMALYQDLADLVIHTDNRTPEEIARLIDRKSVV